MADLIPLDEKLGEVLGLAQAAQAATEKVSTMEGAEEFEGDLRRMHEQAAETAAGRGAAPLRSRPPRWPRRIRAPAAPRAALARHAVGPPSPRLTL